jgi:hypothetical protein
MLGNGEIIATTDADCEAYPSWLEAIEKSFEDSEVVAVSGILDPYDWGNMNKAEVIIYKALFEFSNLLLILLKIFGSAHLCGANTAFHKLKFLEAGSYLPLAYADDTELYKRIKSKGKVLLNRDMKIRYSVRRIKKMGLVKYIFLIFKMEWNVSIMNKKPMKGNYAKQTYN